MVSSLVLHSLRDRMPRNDPLHAPLQLSAFATLNHILKPFQTLFITGLLDLKSLIKCHSAQPGIRKITVG